MSLDINTQGPQRESSVAGLVGAGGQATGDDDSHLLAIARQAESNHERQFSGRSSGWQRAYRAYNSQHMANSKYGTKDYANRSKLFIPKTRSAVRGKLTSAAQALFSTDEVVSVRAETDDDPIQQAMATVAHEVLNYRLDRRSPRGGIPWFEISMGAVQDANLTGIVCSKQYWEFEETEKSQVVVEPAFDEETGLPAIDPETGAPLFEERAETVRRVRRDRPMILPIPPENVIPDPSAPWYDVAQGGEYLIVRWPMTLRATKAMIRGHQNKNGASAIQWRDVDDASLIAAVETYTDKGIRAARDARGTDRYEKRSQQTDDYSTCWVHENFIRTEEGDMCFWSIGSSLMLSDPVPTEDAHPAFFGDRPIVYGYGALEAHNISPQSPVESWQSLQQELNDNRNLRLDAAKQAVLPFAKVRSGKGVDISVLSRLSPGAHIHVRDMDDVEFETIPSGAPQLFRDTANLESDFDELAGRFSTSTVSNNRSLNETVGGMNIMSGDANAVTEFDLRVFVETWVEPVLRQTVQNIQFYESDEVVLAQAAKKAEIWKVGLMETTPELLAAEVSVSVNVGIGSTDPMRRLQKLSVGADLLGKMLPSAQPPVSLNSEEIIPEVMGAIGYKDGMRFFKVEEGAGDDPEAAAREAETAARLAEKEMDAKTQRETTAIKEHGAMQRERMKQRGSLAQTMIKTRADMAARRAQTEAGERSGRFAALFRGSQGGGRSPAA